MGGLLIGGGYITNTGQSLYGCQSLRSC